MRILQGQIFQSCARNKSPLEKLFESGTRKFLVDVKTELMACYRKFNTFKLGIIMRQVANLKHSFKLS